MPLEREFAEWKLTERLGSSITPEHARDIMVDCFATVHGHHYRATRAHMGVSTEAADVRRSVKGMLRLAFKQHDGDYDRPTRESLERVAQFLMDKSETWGAPREVVVHHHGEIRRVLMRVPEE